MGMAAQGRNRGGPRAQRRETRRPKIFHCHRGAKFANLWYHADQLGPLAGKRLEIIGR
jgi:hypothetical protein